MSQLRAIATDADSGTVITDSLAMLNGITVQGFVSTIQIHDSATVGGISSDTLKYKLNAGAGGDFSMGFTDSFEGVLFFKGIVVLATHSTGQQNEEYCINVEWE